MILKLFHMPRLELQRLYPFEALAEISDFVAGLVQRVPKKPNEMKADLQNSTAYSLRSLRVTVVGRVVLFKIPEEDSHPERRVEIPTPVVEWV
ncbi:hypothetical protein HMPREF9225_0680 [Peptoniphilus duerdenii ATCC BAA-1640]|uniref:Uncharacterized protein n=1 Tax=Peptoniphilus duerdenii ATCC BAA-1640 TaxID=862517 RepID=E0NKJ1_9FIRM|nr:hypothetical protein [Peptoniphilus duerdenii]EFM25695.1 hypothetical protein HMPREF9225_0680 [Peptoniphilus duerdenii ATCC BAA-1640]